MCVRAPPLRMHAPARTPAHGRERPQANGDGLRIPLLPLGIEWRVRLDIHAPDQHRAHWRPRVEQRRRRQVLAARAGPLVWPERLHRDDTPTRRPRRHPHRMRREGDLRADRLHEVRPRVAEGRQAAEVTALERTAPPALPRLHRRRLHFSTCSKPQPVLQRAAEDARLHPHRRHAALLLALPRLARTAGEEEHRDDSEDEYYGTHCWILIASHLKPSPDTDPAPPFPAFAQYRVESR